MWLIKEIKYYILFYSKNLDELAKKMNELK